jgi:hypothetical protein
LVGSDDFEKSERVIVAAFRGVGKETREACRRVGDSLDAYGNDVEASEDDKEVKKYDENRDNEP